METSIGMSPMERARHNLAKAPDKLKRFFYSDSYLVFPCITVFLSWYIDIPAIALISLAILGGIAVLILDDLTPTMPLFFISSAIFATSNIEKYLFQFIPIGIFLLLILIHVIIYRPIFRVRKMYIPHLICGVAIFFGGVGSANKISWLSEAGKEGLAQYIPWIVLPLLFYFFLGYCKPNKYVSTKVFISKVLVYFGVLITVQLVISLLFGNTIMHGKGAIFKILNYESPEEPDVNLGWANPNNVATLLLMCFPFGFYLSHKLKKRGYKYNIMGYTGFLGIFLTFSRGGILFGIIIAFFISSILIFKSEHRWRELKPAVIIILLVGIFCAIFFNQIVGALEMAKLQGGTGREKIYSDAIRNFKNNILTGNGMIYLRGHGEETYNNGTLYWYHSTFFQTIGGMGLIGIIAMSYEYIVRYRIIFKGMKNDMFRIFMFFGLLGYELYSLIDCGTFLPYPFVTLAMVLTGIAEIHNLETKLEQKDVLLEEYKIYLER